MELSLSEMHECYDNAHDLLRNQPQNLAKPFLWLSQNNGCYLKYLNFITDPLGSAYEFNSDKDLKNAYDQLTERHFKFMNEFYKHFSKFI